MKTNEQKRPPIVAVLGHVDHGKTTLLDSIRKTSIQAREVGGITQKIGASTVNTKDGKRITFIDTPGHAAFTAMRGHGAQASDIALLIVAADDGVKPQTSEAIKLIRESNIPFVVVITKIDSPNANVESTKGQIENEGILFEGRGGDTPVVLVSAKTGEGIEDLLETISLLWDVTEGDNKEELQGVVIETSQSKGGILASIVLKNGNLKVGETYFAGSTQFKIKGMTNDKGERVGELNPGEAAQILGFSRLPEVGAIVELTKKTHESKKAYTKTVVLKDEIGVLVKASTLGALSAIEGGLPEKVKIVASGVGDVTENDVFLAKESDSIICSFEVKVPNAVLRLADTEGVRIFEYKIIYKLFEKLEEILTSKTAKINGKAEIIDSFPFNSKKIAGCRMVQGTIKRGDRLKLNRDNKNLGNVKVVSIRKNKEEVPQVTQGMECGILFEPQLDFGIGDMLLSVSEN